MWSWVEHGTTFTNSVLSGSSPAQPRPASSSYSSPTPPKQTPILAPASKKSRPLKNKIRRGGRGRNRGKKKELCKKNSWIIYHNNLRGFESKKDSITAILNQVKPNIVTMNETHMTGNKKPELYGYYSYARNRPDKSMGGVATCVSNKELGNTVSMKYSEGDQEYIITR